MSRKCDACGRGFMGIAGTRVGVSVQPSENPGGAIPPELLPFPSVLRWSDGSILTYGSLDDVRDSDEVVSAVEYRVDLYVATQDQLYFVWSYLGKEHLEYLISQLRFVQGAPE